MADPVPPDAADDTGTPRWVKVQGIFVVLLVLLVIGMLAGGGHGPAVDSPGNYVRPEGGHR